MRNFLVKSGINLQFQKPINNIKINYIIFGVEIAYFLLSLYNLLLSKSISGFTVWLNLFSFLDLSLSNIRNELDNVRNSDRYSLYFYLFLFEAIYICIVSGFYILFGVSLEVNSLKYLLFILLLITLGNKFINVSINLYKQI